jgi:AcrR family transcriptional regulator
VKASGVGTRERILEAARDVILSKGLVRATTKEIARAAGVSEGTLYNYFANKEAIFLDALGQLPSGFITLVRGLPARAGAEPAPAVLTEVGLVGLTFYDDAIRMGASIFADPELLARHRQLLAQRHAGPQRANEFVTAYLRAEQDLGRVSAKADVEALAYLFLGAIYQRAYWRAFLGEAVDREADAAFVARLVTTLEGII